MRTKRKVTGVVLTAMAMGAIATAATVTTLSTQAAATHTSSTVKVLSLATTPGASTNTYYDI